MDSALISIVKNGFDWLKEGMNFLLEKVSYTPTNKGVSNFVIMLFKQQSEKHKNKSRKILRSILNNKNQNKQFDKETNLIKNKLKTINSNINLSNEKYIEYCMQYFKYKKIETAKITTQDISEFIKELMNAIHYWQNITRIFCVFNIIISILLSIHYQNFSFLLLNVLTLIMILLIKMQNFYNVYMIIDTINTNTTSFEQSIFYEILGGSTNILVDKEIQKNIENIIALNENTNKNKKIVNEKLLNKKINEGNLEVENISNENILLLIKVVDKGMFRITKNISNYGEQKILTIILNYILKNNLDEKKHILLNIWKIIDKSKCATEIKDWLYNNKKQIVEIIDITENKSNLLHVFSKINERKIKLRKNKNESSNAIIQSLTKIEDTILENMSLKNYIDIFEFIKNDEGKECILINSENLNENNN